MLETIDQILQLKGYEIWSVAPETTVYEALEMMAEKRVGSLVVLKRDQVVGIFGERDYLLKVDLHGRSSRKTLVREVMSEDVYWVTPNTSIDEAMAVVTESRCRHLVVMDREQIVGLASIGDLVKASLEKKDYVIKQLTKYIKGEL